MNSKGVNLKVKDKLLYERRKQKTKNFKNNKRKKKLFQCCNGLSIDFA